MFSDSGNLRKPPLVLRPVWRDTYDGKRRELVAPWSWLGVDFPKGWQTDGLTHPWFFNWYVRRHPRALFASYVHDRCLETMTRAEAAKMFRKALEILGVEPRAVNLMVAGVRLNDLLFHKSEP